ECSIQRPRSEYMNNILTSVSKLAGRLAAVSVFMFAALNVFAEELQFSDLDCAITRPDDWPLMTNLPPQPGMVAAFQDENKTRVIMLMADGAHGSPGVLDERFVSEFERGV